MAEQLKQFMMGLGFQIDESGMAKFEAFVKKSESYAKQTAASMDKLVKTIEGYTKGLGRTASEAGKSKQEQDKATQSYKDFCKQLEECTKGFVNNIDQLKKHQDAQDKDTKSTDRHTDSLRRHVVGHRGLREAWDLSKGAALGFAGALTALAVTGEEMVRRVSKQFEGLYYLSQRTGTAGHALEQLRFQFESIGLDSSAADQAVSNLANQLADFPSTAHTITQMIGRPFEDASDAVRGLGERYQYLLKTFGERSPQVAAYRNSLRFTGFDPNVIERYGRNAKEAGTALDRLANIWIKLGLGDGAKAAKQLEERSVAFRKQWVGTQEVFGKIAQGFAGALMPGITRFLQAALGGLPDINTAFDELCKSFDGFIQNLIGKNGENLKQWMADTGAFFKNLGSTENLEKLNNVLKGTATIIGGIAKSIELMGKYPEIAAAVLGAYLGFKVAGPPGAVVGAVAAVTAASLATRPDSDKRKNEEISNWQRNKGLGKDPRTFSQMLADFEKKEAAAAEAEAAKKTAPEEPKKYQHGGIVGINAHIGEAVLPATLTRLLMGAANQPQVFSTRSNPLLDAIENLSHDFDQWWSGSASFNPIVQLAQEFYEKLDSLLHQLLEDFGFVRSGTTGVGSGSTPETATSGAGGGGGGGARTGGRFGGMGPGGGGSGEGTSSVGETSANVAAKAATVIPALMKDLGLTKEQASALFGNLAHETGGFTALQEKNPRSGRGGYGWAQWTGSRRVAFEKFAQEKGLDPKSDEANYQFLVQELRTTHSKNLAQLKGATTLEEANRAVHRGYEAPGDTLGPNPSYRSEGSRLRYGQQGMAAAGGGAAAGGPGVVPPSEGGRVKELQSRMAAIRRLPLAAQLKAQLEYASEQANVETEVFSGGQAESGPHRTGSHRHDRGEAGDVQLRDPVTKQLLDMRNPADQARMAKFITGSVAAGATGVGGAEGYMGAHGLHIGGGAAGTWGASGRFGTAPKWVQDAYNEGLKQRRELGSRAATTPTKATTAPPTVTDYGKPAVHDALLGKTTVTPAASTEPTGPPDTLERPGGVRPSAPNWGQQRDPGGFGAPRPQPAGDVVLPAVRQMFMDMVPRIGKSLHRNDYRMFDYMPASFGDTNLGAERRAMMGGRTRSLGGGDYSGDGGNYGGGGEVVHKSETTINVVGAADPHGTGEAVRRLQDRNSPMRQRNAKSSLV